MKDQSIELYVGEDEDGNFGSDLYYEGTLEDLSQAIVTHMMKDKEFEEVITSAFEIFEMTGNRRERLIDEELKKVQSVIN